MVNPDRYDFPRSNVNIWAAAAQTVPFLYELQHPYKVIFVPFLSFTWKAKKKDGREGGSGRRCHCQNHLMECTCEMSLFFPLQSFEKREICLGTETGRHPPCSLVTCQSPWVPGHWHAR